VYWGNDALRIKALRSLVSNVATRATAGLPGCVRWTSAPTADTAITTSSSTSCPRLKTSASTSPGRSSRRGPRPRASIRTGSVLMRRARFGTPKSATSTVCAGPRRWGGARDGRPRPVSHPCSRSGVRTGRLGLVGPLRRHEQLQISLRNALSPPSTHDRRPGERLNTSL